MNDHLYYQLRIDNPCHENWDEMLPQEKGKFCLNCQKTVYDFTAKSKEEIIEFFRLRKLQPVCARVRNDVLENSIGNQINTKRIGTYRLAWFAYALFIVFGSALFSCNRSPENPDDDNEPQSEITISDKSARNNDYTVLPPAQKKLQVEMSPHDAIRNALYSTLPDTVILPDIEVAAPGFTSYGRVTGGAITVISYSGEWEYIDRPFPHSPIGKEEEIPDSIIAEPSLDVFPNPSSGQFIIRYKLIDRSPVDIELFNISGQFIQRIFFASEKPEGEYEESIRVTDLPAGIYFLRTVMGERSFTRRLVIAR